MYNYLISHGDVSIKEYQVNYNENNLLIATEIRYKKTNDKNSKDKENKMYLADYINALYSATVKGIPIKKYNKPGIITCNDNYLVVMENGYSIVKKIFDLRNIELPENIKQEIIEIQEYLKKEKTDSSISKYLPLIWDIVDVKATPIIKEEETDEIKSVYKNLHENIYEEQYIKNRKKLYYIGNYDIMFTVIISNILYHNIDFYKKYLSLRLASYIGLYAILDKILNSIGKKIINKNADYNFNNYLELCHKIENGDKETFRSLSEEIGRIGISNNINNSEFYLSIVEDLTILDCYKDESLIPIKVELISLSLEYIKYRSNSPEREMLEEMFLNKLKSIEDKIDRTNKEIEEKDEDTLNFINAHCGIDAKQLGISSIVYKKV